ncbi:MAG TPA: tetratricopeptide repeat protein, partial [Anaerolineaceae bacterium]|nr:tetratricopeptide repeat protein [Anaerolineaceae bacterium]
MIKRALTSISILVFVLTSCTLPFNRTGENRGIPSGTNSAPQLSPTPTITPTPQPQARITLGQADILNGDYEKALAEFWSAREQSTDPEVIQAAQLGVGRVLLLQNDINGAVSQLNWLLTNFAEGESRDTAYFFLGQAYERLQQYLLAADAYQNYVDASPGPLDSEILEMKGDALVRAGEFGAAKLAFLAALKTAQPIREDTLQLKIAQAAAESGGEQDAISIYWALLEN